MDTPICKRIALVHEVRAEIRELKNSLMHATKPEVSHEFLMQVRHAGKLKGDQFVDSYKLAVTEALAASDADHASRGLGNSSSVVAARARIESESMKDLRSIETELDLLDSMIESKRRLLDPTIA